MLPEILCSSKCAGVWKRSSVLDILEPDIAGGNRQSDGVLWKLCGYGRVDDLWLASGCDYRRRSRFPGMFQRPSDFAATLLCHHPELA